MKKTIEQQLLENFARKLIDITEDWNKVNHHDKTNGLSQKAVNAYRHEHPGSKLQTAVTTKPSKLKAGSKAAKRRKSFCARMSGNNGPMKKPNGKPTPKALALRRWNCESIEEMAQMIDRAEQVINEEKQRLDPKCWKGKHKEGTKMKGGVRVNNCVPNESFQPVVPVKSRSQGSVSPEQQKDIDRDVKLLNKYRSKGMSAGSAADRLAKFKHKHMEEQGVAEAAPSTELQDKMRQVRPKGKGITRTELQNAMRRKGKKQWHCPECATYDDNVHGKFCSKYKPKEQGVAEGKEELHTQLQSINQKLKLMRGGPVGEPNSMAFVEKRKELLKQKEQILSQLKQGVAEVSDKTRNSYVTRASDDYGSANFAARASKSHPGLEKYSQEQEARAKKRAAGLNRALSDKRTGREQGVAEGLPQTLRKVVPGYVKREIDKKMDAGKFGKTDADKDANFQRYKKIQDKIKEQGAGKKK